MRNIKNIKKALKNVRGLGDLVCYQENRLECKSANRGEVLRLAREGHSIDFVVKPFIYSVFPDYDVCIRSWWGY